jgi:hypothetical protein
MSHGQMLRMLLGDRASSADGPYTHTFTPDVAPYYETDSEETFADWLLDNDPSTTLPERLAGFGILPAAFTVVIEPNEVPSWTLTYETGDRP